MTATCLSETNRPHRSGRRRPPALTLAIAWLAASPPVHTQDPGPQIMPNYREADLRQVVEAVGEVTGRNFLVDPRVTGQVTFLSYSPMSVNAFYDAFLATLAVHGFIAVEADNLVRIVPDATARVHPGAAGGTERELVVTQVVQLENVGAAQLVPILRPLIPQYGHLAAHPGSNTLIVVDRGSNVLRMLDIIGRMDRASEEDIEVIPLENASAVEVVALLSTLNQASAAEGTPSQPAADALTMRGLVQFDMDEISPRALLFQAGYPTMRETTRSR